MPVLLFFLSPHPPSVRVAGRAHPRVGASLLVAGGGCWPPVRGRVSPLLARGLCLPRAVFRVGVCVFPPLVSPLSVDLCLPPPSSGSGFVSSPPVGPAGVCRPVAVVRRGCVFPAVGGRPGRVCVFPFPVWVGVAVSVLPSVFRVGVCVFFSPLLFTRPGVRPPRPSSGSGVCLPFLSVVSGGGCLPPGAGAVSAPSVARVGSMSSPRQPAGVCRPAGVGWGRPTLVVGRRGCFAPSPLSGGGVSPPSVLACRRRYSSAGAGCCLPRLCRLGQSGVLPSLRPAGACRPVAVFRQGLVFPAVDGGGVCSSPVGGCVLPCRVSFGRGCVSPDVGVVRRGVCLPRGRRPAGVSPAVGWGCSLPPSCLLSVRRWCLPPLVGTVFAPSPFLLKVPGGAGSFPPPGGRQSWAFVFAAFVEGEQVVSPPLVLNVAKSANVRSGGRAESAPASL